MNPEQIVRFTSLELEIETKKNKTFNRTESRGKQYN